MLKYMKRNLSAYKNLYYAQVIQKIEMHHRVYRSHIYNNLYLIISYNLMPEVKGSSRPCIWFPEEHCRPG